MAANTAKVPSAATDIGRMCVPPLNTINAIVADARKMNFHSPVMNALKKK